MCSDGVSSDHTAHSSRSASPGADYFTPSSSQASLGVSIGAVVSDEISDLSTSALTEKAKLERKKFEHKVTEAGRRWDHKELITCCVEEIPERVREAILDKRSERDHIVGATKNVADSFYHHNQPAHNARVMAIYAFERTTKVILKRLGLAELLEGAEAVALAQAEHAAAEQDFSRRRQERIERGEQEKTEGEAHSAGASTPRASGRQTRGGAGGTARGGMRSGKKRSRT